MNEVSFKSITVSAVIGVNAGYNHNNENGVDKKALDVYADLWDKCARFVENDRGIYVPAVITPSRTVYKKEWGCPDNGENTITISCTQNKKFDTTPTDEWAHVAVSAISAFAITFGNKAVTVTIDENIVVYMSDFDKD